MGFRHHQVGHVHLARLADSLFVEAARGEQVADEAGQGRRNEIGLPQALGATRRQIDLEFLVESATLTTIGGVLGAAVGAAITYTYARSQGWTVDVPVAVLAEPSAPPSSLAPSPGSTRRPGAATMHPADAVKPVG